MSLGKFPTLIILLAVAAVSAAVFGALHNQLSYSVGPSYFEDFKFAQFQIDEGLAPRLGAAWVGVQASWWAGMAAAVPAFLFGLMTVPRAQSYFAAGLGAIGLVLILATFAALVGLVGGLAADQTGVLDPYIVIPAGLDRSDFLRAGFMHDSSYAAAALGALLAFWPMRRARAIDNAMARADTAAAPA